MKYIVYFDSGTTNSRIFVLNESYEVLFSSKKEVGSKNSAISGSNRILLNGLKELYEKALTTLLIQDSDVAYIYASGMVTSPYGIVEVPHIELPVTLEIMASAVHCYFEEQVFKRNIFMIPGIKILNEDMAYVGNMRGEEIEFIGVIDEIRSLTQKNDLALIMPGSHTHVIHVENSEFTGIISNLTGELFHALKEETIIHPILSCENPTLSIEQVKIGVNNLLNFGFNRAIYICHAMRIFDRYTPEERYSYAEGVVHGGVREVLEYYCERIWRDCETICIVSNEFFYEIYNAIFEDSKYIKEIIWVPLNNEKIYSLEGLKNIIKKRSE